MLLGERQRPRKEEEWTCMKSSSMRLVWWVGEVTRKVRVITCGWALIKQHTIADSVGGFRSVASSAKQDFSLWSTETLQLESLDYPECKSTNESYIISVSSCLFRDSFQAKNDACLFPIWCSMSAYVWRLHSGLEISHFTNIISKTRNLNFSWIHLIIFKYRKYSVMLLHWKHCSWKDPCL